MAPISENNQVTFRMRSTLFSNIAVYHHDSNFSIVHKHREQDDFAMQIAWEHCQKLGLWYINIMERDSHLNCTYVLLD